MEQKDHATQRQRILMIAKQMTAGKLVLEGRSFHLNQDVLNQAEIRHSQKEEAMREKQQKNDLQYLDIHIEFWTPFYPFWSTWMDGTLPSILCQILKLHNMFS